MKSQFRLLEKIAMTSSIICALTGTESICIHRLKGIGLQKISLNPDDGGWRD